MSAMREEFGELPIIGVRPFKLELTVNRAAIEPINAPVVELTTPSASMRTTAVRTFLTEEYPDQFQAISF